MGFSGKLVAKYRNLVTMEKGLLLSGTGRGIECAAI
jgi:hypothetical protein